MTRIITQAGPVIALGLSLLLMIFQTVPAGNEKYVLAIITGLLGFLARDAVNAIGSTINSKDSPVKSDGPPEKS